ncbi:MAG: hypothetical protein PVSMB11_02930 [Desulfuromonadaceae bacterium]
MDQLVLLKLGYREEETLSKSSGEIKAICQAFEALNNPKSSVKRFKVKRDK